MRKALIVFCFLLVSGISRAQKPNWQNLDLQKDTVFGISTEKAYTEILIHKKKFKPVIVGVIDSGVDTAHEDLKSVIWINPKEKYNGVDDDRDGYADDVHGWNFIGGPNGNINQENLELTRLIRAGKADSTMFGIYNNKVKEDNETVDQVESYEKILNGMIGKMQKDTPELADFKNYHPADQREGKVRDKMISMLDGNSGYGYADYKAELEGYRDHFRDELDYNLNPAFNPRAIVGDDTLNMNEHFYGNADVTGPRALHGTHVSGIIAAVRDNGIGIQGIADHVWILSIRTVPDGDERDKDVANAIRFAADHGAKVVNMSFGKNYSPDKKVVDDAVKYAMSKDVLLVQAAGNDGKNLDHEPNYPNREYLDSAGIAAAYLVVGATGWENDSALVTSFSNYGKRTVDVFAPGLQIYSSVPGSKYQNESGTSMATPVVVGLAALIREYYPKLTALQVKEIIMRSVVKPVQKIRVKDGDQSLSVPMSELCISGGVVNAYQALKLAENFHK